METLWIVVAQRAKASIYERDNDDEFSLVHEFDNPDGRLKDQELIADRPGSAFSSVGTQRHDHSTPTSPSDQVTIDFSKEIARYLDDARHQTRFDSLILIASPELLGLLRQDLAKATSEMIMTTVNKNLGHLSEAETKDYMRDVLQQAASPDAGRKSA